MKFMLIFLLLLLLIAGTAYAGLDESILWRYEFQTDSANGFSFNPGYINSRGLGLIFLHTSPYQLQDLGWDFAGLKYGFGRFGFSGYYRSYRLKDLYSANSYELSGAYNLSNGLDLSISTEWESEEFDRLSKYNRIDIGLNISYSKNNFAILGGFRKINLKKPYASPDIDKPEPILLVSKRLAVGLEFKAGYRRLCSGVNRWYFAQDIMLVKGVGLRLGYMSNPGLLEWGLDLSWENATLIFAYQAISRLSDTIILGLSFGA